jgi:hypothetical protein
VYEVPLLFVFHPCIVYATTVVGRGGYSRVTFDDNVSDRDLFQNSVHQAGLCRALLSCVMSYYILHGAPFGGARPCLPSRHPYGTRLEPNAKPVRDKRTSQAE